MIGEKIRAYREFRGLSQVQLAELSGINVGTIRKYELGIRNPKPDQLEKIASALGLNVSIFLDFNIETVIWLYPLWILWITRPVDSRSKIQPFRILSGNGASLKMFTRGIKKKSLLSKMNKSARKNWKSWKLYKRNGSSGPWVQPLDAIRL